MKYTNLLIVCSLFAGSLAFAETPAPAIPKAKAEKVQADAKASADAAKEKAEKMKKEAEAKAKAEAEAKKNAEKNFNELSRSLPVLADQNKHDEVRATCEKLVPLIKLGIDPSRFGCIFDALSRDRNDKGIPSDKAAEAMKKYYEMLLPMVSGDVKYNWTTAYADLLEKKKMAPEDKIYALRKSRYQIKGMSPRTFIKLVISDNDLNEVDPVVQEILATCKNDNEKLDTYRFVINELKAKKVYGSKLAFEYHKKMVDLNFPDDVKVVFMNDMLSHASTYSLMTDEEIEAYRQGMLKMKLSPAKKASLYFTQFGSCQTLEEKRALLDKAIEAAGDDATAICDALRFCIPAPWDDPLQFMTRASWFADYVKRYTAALAKYNFLADFLNGFARYRAISFEEKEAIYHAFAIYFRREMTDVHAAYVRCPTLVVKAKAEVDTATALLNAEKDGAKRAVLQAELNKKRAALQQAERDNSLANQDYRRLMERINRFYASLGTFYYYEANRYYEAKDPVVLMRYVKALAGKLRMIDQGDFQNILDTYAEMAKTSYTARDFAAADAAIHSAEKIINTPDVQKFLATNNENTTRRVVECQAKLSAIKAFMDYDNEKYAEAAAAMRPLVDNEKFTNLWRNDDYKGIYEKLVRALVATEDYDNAFKYAEGKLYNNLPWYMRDRYKSQLEDLKQRIGK